MSGPRKCDTLSPSRLLNDDLLLHIHCKLLYETGMMDSGSVINVVTPNTSETKCI